MSEMKMTAVELFAKEVQSGKDFTPQEARDALDRLEAFFATLPQVETGLTHHFSPGVYGRELAIPKDTIVIGKIHKHKNMAILLKGEVSLFSAETGSVRIKAPYIAVSEPGIKRMVYAHEDSIWVSVHGTHETDVAKIEEEVIAKTYADVPGLIAMEEVVWLGEQ